MRLVKEVETDTSFLTNQVYGDYLILDKDDDEGDAYRIVEEQVELSGAALKRMGISVEAVFFYKITKRPKLDLPKWEKDGQYMVGWLAWSDRPSAQIHEPKCECFMCVVIKDSESWGIADG